MWQWLAVWSLPVLAASLIMCLVGIWMAAWIIIRMPEDHFVRQQRPRYRHPIAHAVWVVVRSIIGATLMILGIVQLFGPGQGVLCILLGLSIIEFPGKHRLVVWLLSWRSVRRTLNWVRRKAHKPPLQFPDASVISEAG